jgi:secreted PhoX family phosphatase
MNASRTGRLAGISFALAALAAPVATAAPADSTAGSGAFQFEPVPASAPCTTGGNAAQPFVLPPGYSQRIVAFEGQPGFRNNPDMNTQNETGADAGRYLYRPHENGPGDAGVSVTDLWTDTTRELSFRPDWERLDGIVWTQWGTLLTAEETNAQAAPDPAVPQARKGLVYEIDPATGTPVARPALGSKSHEGMRFDSQGNLYSISEFNQGHIFKFTPDRPGDLSSGQLYALKITEPNGDRTGEARWLPLDRTAVQVDADVAADAVGATQYDRPEDVEINTDTGNTTGGASRLYVAVTEPEETRVLAIDLREPAGGATHDSAYVWDYVRRGQPNVPADFEWPDNLALDRNGNLYIAEDPPSNPPGRGADVWVAEPPNAVGTHQPAERVVRFASLTDCAAEPTGLYFNKGKEPRLYVNAQHRGGDGIDEAVEIRPPQNTP